MSATHQLLLGGGAAAAATDPDFANVRFLLHFDGADGSTTFSDHSPIGTRPVWDNNSTSAQIDTAQSKFGGASCLFDGTDDRLRDSTAAGLLGTADMTVEAWVRLNAAGRHTFVSRYNGAGGWMLDIEGTGKLRFLLQNSAGSFHAAVGTTTLSTSIWYHVAGTIAGTTIRAFLDGALEGSGTFSGTRADPASSIQLYIGSDASGTAGRFMNGWIDDARGTIGARYTANFTPPAAPFPNS